MERDELLWGEPDPGKDKSSAQAHDFNSKHKAQPLSISQEAFSEHLLHASTLLRNVHKNEQDKLAGWGQSVLRPQQGSGSIYASQELGVRPSHQGEPEEKQGLAGRRRGECRQSSLKGARRG